LKILCDEVTSSKDKVIRDFQQEIKVKEEEYFKCLTRQADDIGMYVYDQQHSLLVQKDSMLKISREQWTKLLETADTELNAIEDAYDNERAIHLQNNNTELEALYEDRRNKEVYLVKRYQCAKASSYYESSLNSNRGGARKLGKKLTNYAY
jgi:dynein regulatory complex protein 1